MNNRSGEALIRWFPLVIVAAGVWAYHNSFSGPFIFDNDVSLLRNTQLQTTPWWDPSLYLAPAVEALIHRPVLSFTFAINYAFGGLAVQGYHLLNLAIHLLAGVTLYGLVRRTLQTPRLRGRYGAGAPWLALSATLLWIVHPLLTESVTYVIQRAESLMGLFYLLTCYAVVRGVATSPAARWFLLAVGSCALGMGTKQVMVTAPLMVLCYDRAFLSDSFRAALQQRRGLYLGLAATWLILLGLVLVSPPVQSAGFGLAALTPWTNGLTQLGVMLHYLRLAVWPHPLLLVYNWPVVTTASDVVVPAVLMGALVLATAWAWRQRAAAGFLGVWVFLLLLPSSVIPMPSEMVAERRMYLALAGVVMFFVIGGSSILRRVDSARLRRGVGVGVVGTAVIVLGLATIRRNTVYADRVGFWEAMVTTQPDHQFARGHLSQALLELGRYDEAAAHYRVALQLRPGIAGTHGNLGLALARQGHLEEAATHYREALRLDPNFSEAHHNLGDLLARQGELYDAQAHFQRALVLRPASAKTHHNLGVLLARQGHWLEAIEHFRAALALDPDYTTARDNLDLAMTEAAAAGQSVSPTGD